MGILEILSLTNLASFGISLSANLVSHLILKAAEGKEPEFNEIVQTSIRLSKKEFQAEFTGVEIHESQFIDLLNDTVRSLLSHESGGKGSDLSQVIRDGLYQREMLYHSNETTMMSYCDTFSKIFCFILFNAILGSKYSTLLETEHLLSSRKHEVESDHNQKVLIDGQQEMLDSISRIREEIILEIRLENKVLSNENSVIEIPEYSERKVSDTQFSEKKVAVTTPAHEVVKAEPTAKESEEIASRIKKIETLKKEKNYINGIQEAKKLILDVPKSNFPLYSKVSNLLLALHLQGTQREYEEGLKIYSELDQSMVTAYSKVIICGFLNNLKRWDEGLKEINSIGSADIISFSNGQKDVYFQIKSLLQFHMGLERDAQTTLENMNDKQDDEYKYLQLLVYSKDKDTNYLDVASEFIENRDDLRLVSGAINFVLDRFNLLKSELENPFLATDKLQIHFDLIIKRTSELILSTKEHDDYFQSALTGLICVFQLVGRHEDAQKYIDLGMEDGITNFIFLHNSALCTFLTMNYEDTYKLLSKASINDLIKTNSFDMYVSSIQKTGRVHKYNELIDQLDSLGLAESKIERFKSTIYQLSLEKNELLVRSKANFEKFSDKDWACYDYADALIDLKMFVEAEDLLLAAEKVTNVKFVAFAKLAKYYALNRGLFAKAIPYYEQIISKYAPEPDIVEYLHCLNNLKSFPRMIQIVDELDSEESKPKVQLYKAYAFWQLGQIPLSQVTVQYKRKR